jgi:hypothetical protein
LKWPEREPSRFAAGGSGELENSTVAFTIERAADGDRPRSGQTDPLPICGYCINLVVAAVCDRRKRRSQSAATVKEFENDTAAICDGVLRRRLYTFRRCIT